MAKKKETKEDEAVKEAVDKVGVRGDWPDGPTTIQSTYAEGDIPLGTAVYTADEVDALFAAKDHTHSSIQSPNGNTKIKAVDSGKGFIETYGEEVEYSCEVTVYIPQVPGATCRIRATHTNDTSPMMDILFIDGWPGATVAESGYSSFKKILVNGSEWGFLVSYDESAPGLPELVIPALSAGECPFAICAQPNEGTDQFCTWSDQIRTRQVLSSKEISTTDQVPTVPVREVQKNGVALTPDANGAVNVKGVYYATCDTAQAATVKVATIKNLNEVFVLEEGVVVYVRFTNASPTNTSGGSTGICKLNVANTGEKNIYGPTSASLGSSVTYTWNSNAIIGFIYDAVSDCWRALSPSLALNLNCAGVVGVQDQLSKPSVDLTNRRGVATAAILTNNIGLSIAPLWVKNASTSYSTGDFVMYTDGKLYKAKVDIAANTAWKSSNWQSVTVMAEIPDAVSVTDPATATSTDEGKAADAYGTKQALDGKADLVNGLIPSSQLPSYVDDVLEYDGTNHFPTTGETGKIYVDTDTNKTYRWSGTQYVEISASDVSLTSEGGYPYQLTVGSTSCNIDSVSLDSMARTISVNGGTPVSFGDSVSISGGGSGPYQLSVNNNYQCSIPVASVSTINNSVTVDGNTLYVPSISISGQTITLNGMGYNMYPISWNSTTRMLDLYGNSVTTLYVSDLEWDATYNRLKHHDGESTYLIGWEEVSGTLSRTYDRLTIGNKTIYLDGNDLHIGKDSIAIAPSGNILAGDIWYDTNRTSTVYSQLQYLIGSDWGALRVGSSGNVLDYNGNAISKGGLKLNGTAIATLSDIPVVYDGLLTLQQNGVQQTTFSANSPNPTTFNVETYSFATSSSLADVEVKVATCTDSYFSLFAGAFVLVEFDTSNTHSAPKLNVNSTGAKPMLSGDGTAFKSWSANQVVPFIYDGSVWRVVGSSYGIDSTPTNGSSNLVTSNGIYQFVGRYALSNGDGISITNTLISVNGTDGHGTTFNNPGGGNPLYIDVDDGSTSQAGIVQLDDTPKNDSTVAATPTSVNTVAKDIAPNWAKANAYAQGAYVTKDGVLYKAKAAIAANTNWNASSWQATEVAAEFIPKCIETTYSNLVTLRSQSKLIPGASYRITDYVTKVHDADGYGLVRSAEHPFDLIVFADSNNKLNESAHAIQHAGDSYFSSCNLGKWEVKYTLDNDDSKYYWADTTNGKGVIYWLKDEWDNECPYDFKNAQFKRFDNNEAIVEDGKTVPSILLSSDLGFRYGFAVNQSECFSTTSGSDLKNDGYSSANTSYEYYSVYETAYVPINSPNVKWFYTFDNGQSNDITVSTNMCSENKIGVFGSNYCHMLNLNVFFGSGYNCPYGNICGGGFASNTFGVGAAGNIFESDCYCNTFASYCKSNTFGSECYDNTFGSRCENNIFGNHCHENTFGGSCNYNTFGGECFGNTFGSYCEFNTFGSVCNNITFGNYCSNNTFGSYCNDIKFGTASTLRNNIWNLIVEGGNGYIYLNATGDANDEYRNVTIAQGVNTGEERTWKTITDSNVNQNYRTVYQPANSKVVSV